MSRCKDADLRFEDLDGLSPEEQFRKLADTISQISDSTKKGTITVALFGRTGTNLLPMFTNGAAGIEQRQRLRGGGLPPFHVPTRMQDSVVCCVCWALLLHQPNVASDRIAVGNRAMLGSRGVFTV